MTTFKQGRALAAAALNNALAAAAATPPQPNSVTLPMLSYDTREAIEEATAGAWPGYARIRKDRFTYFRKAMARARSGVAPGNSCIICLGDSTTRGRNSQITANQQYKQAYPHVLARILQAKTGVKFGRDNWMGEGNMDPQDERLVITGFVPSGGGLGGFAYIATSTASIVFTPQGAWNAAEIYYLKLSDNSFTVTINGSPPTTGADAHPAVGPNTYVVTKSGAAAVQPLSIAWGSGSLRVMGMRCYNTAEPEITVFNCGNSGGQAQNATGTNANIGGEVWLDYMAPSAVVLDFGINEYRNGVALTTYQQNMETIINRLQPYCDVVLKTALPDNQAPASPGLVPQSTYVELSRELASTYNLPLVDVNEIWGSHAAGNALGYYYDNVHLTALGHANVAGLTALPFVVMD